MMTPIRKLPFVLLGLMTAAVFLGPFVIWIIMRGGSHPQWPPDRPVEWITFLSIVGLVAALMIACLGLAIANRRDHRNSQLNLDRAHSSNDDLDLKR